MTTPTNGRESKITVEMRLRNSEFACEAAQGLSDEAARALWKLLEMKPPISINYGNKYSLCLALREAFQVAHYK